MPARTNFDTRGCKLVGIGNAMAMRARPDARGTSADNRPNRHRRWNFASLPIEADGRQRYRLQARLGRESGLLKPFGPVPQM
jgi:hypothetical protein